LNLDKCVEPTPETVARAAGGDVAAQHEVLGALQRPIYRLAVRMLASPADAADATQEALLRVLGGLPTYRANSTLTTWALRVAARAVLDFKRGAARRPQLTFDAFEEDLESGLDPAAVERSEDSVYLGQVLLGCTRALLQCLDGDHRLAYVVGEVLQLAGPDGAEVCGVSEQAFRQRLSRARELVRAALDRQCGVVNPEARCQCHRRLATARRLGRAGPHLPGPGLDAVQLRRALRQLSDLATRVAALHAAEPRELVPPAVAARIRSLPEEVAAHQQDPGPGARE
jgi:RNA polymerase sigma factor (sigma-70 family)